MAWQFSGVQTPLLLSVKLNPCHTLYDNLNSQPVFPMVKLEYIILCAQRLALSRYQISQSLAWINYSRQWTPNGIGNLIDSNHYDPTDERVGYIFYGK